jgi:cysteine-rich repeat protein
MLLCMSTFVCLVYGGTCQDGIKDASEECDDGNQYSFDGCSRTCLIEDPTEDVWLCTTAENALSVCCLTLVHPVSGVKMCSCADVVQPVASEGFTITPTCLKRDINECHVPSVCHPKVCISPTSQTTMNKMQY